MKTISGIGKLSPEKLFGPYKSVDEMCTSMENNETKWDKFTKIFYWPIYRFVNSFNWKYVKGIRRFIQRGYRGWCNADTWSFDAYLANVILDGLKYLKIHKHGYPSTCKNEKEWDRIMDKMIYTFDIEKGVCDSDIYIPNNAKEYIRLKKTFKNMPTIKLLTGSEHKKYEEGWKLFRKYFNALWD